MSRFPSDPYLAAALATALAAAALIVALTGTIALLRWRLRRSERRWDAFVADWRPRLLAVVLAPDTPLDLPALPARDHLRFMRLWAYLHASLRGGAGERLNDAARSLGIDETARRLLAHGSRSEQLQAVLAAGFLRDAQAWDSLVAIARSGDSLLSVHAARALVRIEPLRAANGLLPLVVLRHDWDLGRVASFLGEAQQAFWLLMAKTIPHLQVHELPRALLLTEALRIQLPDPTLARLLQAGQPPQVLRAALRLTESFALAPLVRECLAHADAGVREEAALRMGQLAGAADVPALAALLDDPQWPVRMAAARGLARLPFLDRGALEALLPAHPAAADCLRQVVAERGLG